MDFKKALLRYCLIDEEQRNDLKERFEACGYECDIVSCHMNTKAAEINLSKEGVKVGRVTLLPLHEGKNLNILGIRTQMDTEKPDEYQHKGVGKDILRVVLSFALDKKFERLTTSIFARTGSGFFLSQGFFSTAPHDNFEIKPITPEWDRARGVFPDKNIEEYRSSFNPNSTQSTLALARSPIGKTVVFNCGLCGCVNLNDEKQLRTVMEILFGKEKSALQSAQHTADDFACDCAP